MQGIKYKSSAWVAFSIMLVFVTIRVSMPPKNILSFDVFGYYLYLPATFIYDDPGIKDLGWVEQVNEKYNAAPSIYQVAKGPDNNWVIRFYAGTAIMYAPFFLGGHAVALLTDYAADGFSRPYQWAIIIAGIFYTLLGVWFLRKTLLTLFSEKVTSITLILIFIGSNVAFFCTFGNDAPHIYIFTLFTVILWLSSKWHTQPRAKYAIALGLVSGLTAITRPIEILVLLVPILWGIKDWSSALQKFRLIWQERRDLILIILFALLAISPQIIYWKFASGQWVFNSYNDPQSGFNFDHPRFAYVLFGFRKGFYVYSPMMIFATIGFYHLFKLKRQLFAGIFLFFLINVYIIACYSTLVSYGWRAFVESHAVLAIPLACFVQWGISIKKPLRIFLGIILLLFILLNFLKSYQALRGIIDGSRMTCQAYFKDFFVLDPRKMDRTLLLVERTNETDEFIPGNTSFDRKVYTLDFEKDVDPKHSDTLYHHGGKYSQRMDSTFIWSTAINIPFNELTDHYYAWLRASVWIYEPDPSPDQEVLLAIHFVYDHRPYKYRTTSLKNIGSEAIANKWYQLQIDYLTPEVRTSSDPCKVYVWYKGKKPIYIDDLTLEVFEPKKGVKE